jgi:hypothetical protein
MITDSGIFFPLGITKSHMLRLQLKSGEAKIHGTLGARPQLLHLLRRAAATFQHS